MASIQLSVAEPCHEDWNQMLPEEKGRFCLSCQKTVVDFTHMTDGQIFDYFNHYRGSTCGQFVPEQLNRNITRPATRSRRGWRYFWQMLLPAVLTFTKSDAQTMKGRVAPKTVCKSDTDRPESIIMGLIAAPVHRQVPGYQVQGRVLNPEGAPIPYATITTNRSNGVVADSAGLFSIKVKPGESLTVSYIGYHPTILTIDSLIAAEAKNGKGERGQKNLLLKTDVRLQQFEEVIKGEVAVIGFGKTSSNTLTGGAVSVVRRNFIFSQL